MSVAAAAEASAGKSEAASFYSNRFAVHYGIGQLPVGRFQNLMKGATGDAHLFRAFLLVQILEVFQADGLHLFECEDYALERSDRHASGLEERRTRREGHLSQFHRSWHISLTPAEFLTYVRNKTDGMSSYEGRQATRLPQDH